MEEKSTLQEALDFLRSREKCNLLMVMTNIIVFVILAAVYLYVSAFWGAAFAL